MLSNEAIVRAWRDPKFRSQVNGAVPDHPSGSSTVTTVDLAGEMYNTSPRCTDAGPVCTEYNC